MNDNQIEQDIKAAGADKAPRITPADIEANIASEHYFTAADGAAGAHGAAQYADTPVGTPVPLEDFGVPQPLELLTFCVLVLRNGFTVTGQSACASPENFDAKIGRKIARANAVQKVWLLEGYLLREKLAFGGIHGRQPAQPTDFRDRVRHERAELAAKQREEAFRQHEQETAARINAVNRGDKSAAFQDDELVYAATARCPCGAGMAYPNGIGMHGSWNCSDILTLRALTKGQEGAKEHSAPMPFAFYKVKSELQPSAQGATTRPKSEAA